MGRAAPGGAALGNAQGKILIDTSDLLRIQALTQQIGQSVSRNLGQIDTAAKRNQNSFGVLAGDLRGLANAFGIATGAAAAYQALNFALRADATTTAFERQRVAAVSLAGSQEKLNELMATYDRVTGGAIDQATALGDVTRLQAVGFADTAEELEKFAVAARGISVAMGSTQDYIVGQLQLAIANQSVMRLDQLGLGVSEVKERIDQLKAADRSLAEEMAYQNAILGIATEKYGALASSTEAQATGAEKSAKAWRELSLAFGNLAGPTIDNATNAFANLLNLISTGFNEASAALERFGGLLQRIGEATLPAGFRQQGLSALNWLGYSLEPSATPGAGSRPAFAGRQRSAGYTDDQTNLMQQWAQDVREIERNAASARLDATRQYERQRTEVIADYGKSIVREEQDFARNRARAIADHNREIADMQEEAAKREADAQRSYARAVARLRSDAAKREADWLTDYNERIAELREAGNERLQELEADYNQSRERAAEAHRDRLLDAAGRLDAVAVRAEQRRYEREQRDAAENYNEQRTKAQEALSEQLADAEKAYRERIQDAREADQERLADMREALDEQLAEQREADAQRLADMQEDFERRLAREDQDRAIMMERRAQDHADQMRQLEQAQAERMAKINEQEAKEKASMQEAFLEQLSELGLHNAAWLAIQKARQEESLRLFDEFWKGFAQRFAMQGPSLPPLATLTGGGIDLAGGSSVPPVRTSFPTSFAGAAQAAGRSVTFGEGSIVVNAAAGMNEQQLARLVRQEMIAALEEVE